MLGGVAVGLRPGALPAADPAAGQPSWMTHAVVQEVKSWSYDDYTRVVVYLDRKADFKAVELPADAANDKPPRIYLDLPEARIAPSVPSELPIGDGLLTRARIAQFDKRTARLVLDLVSLAEFQVVPFRDPYRLVIDVRGKGLQPPAPAKAPPQIVQGGDRSDPVAALLDGGGAAAPKPPPVVAKPEPPRQQTIVVDAGHGGKDPGAIGVKGLYEKHVVLDVALQVADRLKKAGHRVILTRDDDTFLKLEERTIIANREKADLFVSIHANSAASSKAYGIETYHLAPASDKRSAEVAARENALSSNEDDALDELIAALKFSSRQNTSSILAKFVQSTLADTLAGRFDTFRDLGVKGAPFYVLVGTNMPAVLVEIGFVTHPSESKRLQDRSYQSKLADSIVGGVRTYLKKSGEIPI